MSDYNSVAPPSTIPNNVDPSSAFADALQRARQIAAKINTPSGEATTNGTVAQKRPLEAEKSEFQEGSAPKKVAAMNDPYGAQLAAMQRNSAPNAVLTEEYKVPDKMVGLIIGRGGEQITRLQAESGCKVQMAADSGGLPDRPCSLTGSRQAIEKARDMIQSIISRGAPLAPSMSNDDNIEMSLSGANAVVEVNIPAGKVGLVIGKRGETIKELQDRANVKMVMIQEGPQITGQDKPLRITGDPQKCEHAKQLVMDLITEKELENTGRSNFRNQYQNEYGGIAGNPNRNDIPVPRPAVGVVIGKSGEMIKKIQSDTGARVQFQQVKDDGPGDRLCMVSGTPEQIHNATNIIHELINSVMQKDGGMRGGGVGRVGPPGRFGGFNDRRGGGAGGGNFGGPNIQEITYTVPAGKCGIVIGKGGETIRNINSQSGAHVELDRNAPPNPHEKAFTIRGTPEQVQQAQELIAEKIGMPPPSPGQQPTQYPVQNQEPQHNQQYTPQGWGNAYQQWNQSGQSDPAGAATAVPNATAGAPAAAGAQQPDYSQAWVEYYRSLGMFREAEMVEQQARANQQSGQPTQSQVGMAQPGQPAQFQAPQANAAATPQVPQSQPAQQQYAAQYGQYAAAAQPQPAAQQFAGQQPAAAGYNYNYPGYSAPQQ